MKGGRRIFKEFLFPAEKYKSVPALLSVTVCSSSDIRCVSDMHILLVCVFDVAKIDTVLF